MAQPRPQLREVPVRVYERGRRVMLAAPMPGLEPEDITVVFGDGKVTIRGEFRGPGQERLNLMRDEWTVGPYYREVDLPQPVDWAHSNASYDNGVLVLTMPATGGQRGTGEIHLDRVRAGRGEHVGHTGKQLRPTTTEEHRRSMDRARRAA